MVQGNFPAFPAENNGLSGMDLRTYMATQFMAAILANPEHIGMIPAANAEWSARCADALITELNKEK